MSRAWRKGSTRAWRRLRAHVLTRDNHTCQLKLAGCTTRATQAHHLDGIKAGLICPPNRLVAACGPCNRKVGDPTRDTTTTTRPHDPAPNPPRTNW